MTKKILFTIILLFSVAFLRHNFPYALNDNSDRAYLILYGLILISYVGSAQKYRIMSAFNVQHMMIWILLSLILIVGYSFKGRIESELLPNRPVINNKSFTIKKSFDGHYHIEVVMNGKNINCLIDTGASSIAIDLPTAKMIGLKTANLSFLNPTQTANGIIYSANAKVSLLKIADIILNDINISVNNTEMNGCLLGLSFLNTMSKINIEENTMTLTSS